jgi:hypothetical protein
LSKTWGWEQKEKKEIHNGMEAITALKDEPLIECEQYEKLLHCTRKVTRHVPGITEDDITNEQKCDSWIKECKRVKGKISHSMHRIKHTENNEQIKRLTVNLQKEGGE